MGDDIIRCSGMTYKGPCRAWPIKGTDRCYAHSAKQKDNHQKKTGTRQYFDFVARSLFKYGEKARAGDLDSDALDQLRELRELLDEQTAEVVHALRSETGGAHSWAEIGGALGMTRAAAYKKYGSAETDARSPGAQPGHMR